MTETFQSSRPWQPTPAEAEQHGYYSDYAAFERWFQEAIDDSLHPDEDSIWDNMNTFQQIHLYVVLAKAFDAIGEQPKKTPNARPQSFADSV
jgi:hypothetical protein